MPDLPCLKIDPCRKIEVTPNPDVQTLEAQADALERAASTQEQMADALQGQHVHVALTDAAFTAHEWLEDVGVDDNFMFAKLFGRYDEVQQVLALRESAENLRRSAQTLRDAAERLPETVTRETIDLDCLFPQTPPKTLREILESGHYEHSRKKKM